MNQSEQLLHAGIKCYHAGFTLPDGSETALVANAVHCKQFMEHCQLDKLNYANRSLLDVGCWDGAYGFFAERRGANRVVGLDDPQLRMWDIGNNSAWEALHKLHNSRATFVTGNVYALPFAAQEFDIVLGLGLLYHLSDPLLAVANLTHCAKELVVIETWGSCAEDSSIQLYPPRQPNRDDPTNVYCLSKGWLKTAMRIYGFSPTYWRYFAGSRLCGHFVRDPSLTPSPHPATVFPR